MKVRHNLIGEGERSLDSVPFNDNVDNVDSL